MRHIALGKRHNAPVAHAVEALAAAQRGEHRRQLIARHVAVAHVHLDEVRDQRKTQLHPRRPLCHEPIEGRSGEHLARSAKLRKAPVEQLAGQVGLAQRQRHRAVEELGGQHDAGILQRLIAEGLLRGGAQLGLLARVGGAGQHHLALAVERLHRQAYERRLLLPGLIEVEGKGAGHRAQSLPPLGQAHVHRRLQHRQRPTAERRPVALGHEGRASVGKARLPQKREGCRRGALHPRGHAVGEHVGPLQAPHHQRGFGQVQVVAAIGSIEQKGRKRCVGGHTPRFRRNVGGRHGAAGATRKREGSLAEGVQQGHYLRLAHPCLALAGAGSAEGRAPEQALVRKEPGHHPGHGPGRLVEGLQAMGEGELLAVGVELTALHVAGEVLDVAHLVGSARTAHRQAQRPEAPVVDELNIQAHAAGRHAQGRPFRTTRGRGGQPRRAAFPLRQQSAEGLARAPCHRSRSAHGTFLEAARLGKVGGHQSHAVLAQAVEAGDGRAGALVVDDARLVVAEHHRGVEVVGDARG